MYDTDQSSGDQNANKIVGNHGQPQEVSVGIKDFTGSWTRDHIICYALVEHLSVFYSYHETLQETEIKTSEVINWAEKNLKEVQALECVMNTTVCLGQIYREN